MDEYGQHLRGVIGPYNEGFPLSLACEGEGGMCYFRYLNFIKYNFITCKIGKYLLSEFRIKQINFQEIFIRYTFVSLTCLVENKAHC